MKKTIHIISVLTLTATISALTLASVNNWAKPLIEENAIKAISEAIFQVQPSAKSYEKIPLDELKAFEVFDENKNSIGYAVVHQGNGFQGTIKLIFGIDKNLERITSIEILEQVETPGLGSLITEENYKNQFRSLSVNPVINLIKGKSKTADNQVKAITGATISSRAVVNIVNDAIRILRKYSKEEK
ncbi:MAG: RnfABCDGE type electron transport complex subunit G [Ignavibacteria bacterium]|nr:RnfABCDGE type electron transport complex subunit G [Ignavibacteria bacterium]